MYPLTKLNPNVICLCIFRQVKDYLFTNKVELNLYDLFVHFNLHLFLPDLNQWNFPEIGKLIQTRPGNDLLFFPRSPLDLLHAQCIVIIHGASV